MEANKPTKKEVFITHVFNAPPDIVFKAWTDPHMLVNWYAPDGCTIEYKSIEVREGGSFHSCIHDPVHGDCWIVGTYKEFIPGEKLVFSMALSNELGELLESVEAGKDENWPKETTTTVTFSPQGNQTKLTLHQTAPEEEAKKSGAYQSWIKMFNRLNGLVDHGEGNLDGSKPVALKSGSLPLILLLLLCASLAVLSLSTVAESLSDKRITRNKQTVTSYMDGFSAGDHRKILSCLTDDVIWEMPGVYLHTGKQEFDKEIENDAFVGRPTIAIIRLIEENDIVIAEGTVKSKRKDGGSLDAVFCDVFQMKNGKIRKLTSYLMDKSGAK